MHKENKIEKRKNFMRNNLVEVAIKKIMKN